jgi:Type II secretion system (T2SS), protein E, N-terminal domain
MARKRIGDVLRERGTVTNDDLEVALAFQRERGVRLGAALIAKGLLTEEDLAAALGQALELPVIDIPEKVDLTALHLLKSAFCEAHEVFPLHLEDRSSGRRQLTLAVADPLDIPVLEEAAFVTGCRVTPVLATPSQIRLAVLRHYHQLYVDPRKSASGRMTMVRPGDDDEVVETTSVGGEPTLPDEDEVLNLTEQIAQGDELTALIAERERGRKRPKMNKLADDLSFLTGRLGSSDVDRLESLERKFWALMRLMAKKGLLDKDEFLSEFDE